MHFNARLNEEKKIKKKIERKTIENQLNGVSLIQPFERQMNFSFYIYQTVH